MALIEEVSQRVLDDASPAHTRTEFSRPSAAPMAGYVRAWTSMAPALCKTSTI
jgi:hypothetical protein